MPFIEVAYWQDDGRKRQIILNTDNITETDVESRLVRMTNGREYRLIAGSYGRLIGLLESRGDLKPRDWGGYGRRTDELDNKWTS